MHVRAGIWRRQFVRSNALETRLSGRHRVRLRGTTSIIRFCARRKPTMRVVPKALTFADVLLVPSHPRVVPRDVSLATRLTKAITLNVPLLSAAMHTVTDARLAIAIA